MKKIVTGVLFYIFSFVFAQASFNMDLVGNLPYPQGTNDVWGYSNGLNEYALVGTRTGFSVVDISCPQYPNELFSVPGSQSIWRDIKTWGKYAYVTTEASDGLLIVDLSDLTGQTYVYTEEFFTTSHNIYIDENGYAYIFGTDTGNGGAIILDLTQDPMNPTLAGIFDDYYLHDGMVRGDTLWGSAIYAGVFSIIDVSDKTNPIIMSSYPTSCQFSHNAWISDDNNYLFTTDETAGCYVGSYDVSDIYDIQEIDLIQEWTGDGANGDAENVVPHNTHVLGDYLVTSYYTSGITIIDASDPFNLIEVGYYDTSPLSGSAMDGCWGAYPYLPSGLMLATDQQEGLFVLHSSQITHDDFSDIMDAVCEGCTDDIALNYNPDAVEDNGSCVYISGCTDIAALNYNAMANVDDNSCEYYCDDFIIQPPDCNSPIQAEYGEYVMINCNGDNLTFFDENNNILSAGSAMYVTSPIYENTTFFAINEEVVEDATLNTGEPEHQGNSDYSSDVYNGGLLFDCYFAFTLNSIKVYGEAGERTIELRDNAGNLIIDVVVDVPLSEENGHVIELGWSIDPGSQYLLTTNTQMNNENFGNNNPMFKRTTGGLPEFPFIVENVLEINEGYFTDGTTDGSGSATDYYYYFYDWNISYQRSCQSIESVIDVVLNTSSIAEDMTVKSLIKSVDFLGREESNTSFKINIYDDGTINKEIILK